ncbi:mandelate racemase/muconate lactonizing enzyme family protein [Aquisphaera insulae]|uniref:mandelate racemase/muconate lactonizing enzyme family protein n=1 Tax=Aquisphaera insulae TaxID=2712864 RepID=UPI0013ED30AE|nr:enolase C-terminal domain-like protein [Aquisphaera insulae]
MTHSRRDFLNGALAASVGATARGASSVPEAGPRIARVDTFPIVYPTIGRFKFLEGPRGEPGGRPAVLVRLTAEDGTTGWGQSVPIPRWSYETIEGVDSTIRKYLAPLLVGRDPLDFDGIHAAMGKAIAPSFSTGQPICKAGIDLALHDLAGKLRGTPAVGGDGWRKVAGKHGPGNGRVLLSWTLNPRSLDEVEGLVAKGKERGYQHFNVKVAPDPKVDLELCRIVRRLAPDGFLWADANGGYDEATALDVAPKLADLGVPVLEQPLPANRLGGYRRLRQQKALPILMDEGIVSSVELIEFIKLGLLDGVAMKPARCGGLTEARRQIEILRDEGLMVLGSGLTDPDVSLAASLRLFDACGLEAPAALNGPQFLSGSVLKAPFEVSGGMLRVPEGPGLGVEVDESRIEPFAVKLG